MKKLLAILLLVILCLCFLASCEYFKHEHITGDWRFSDEHHWRITTCTQGWCDIDPMLQNHVDENNDNVCDVCGYTKSVTEDTGHTEHTYEWIITDVTHQKLYTCDCPSPEVASSHYDKDRDNKCDECFCLLNNLANDMVKGTYFLPYISTSDPAYITFFNDGRCVIGYSTEQKAPYIRNYWIEDGKVYIDIESSPKVHVFTIYENALVFDSKLSTANLWDSTYYYSGAVVYFLPDASTEEMLGTIVMANKGLESIPSIEKIYTTYEIQKAKITNKAYAFMIGEEAMGKEWSNKALGTDLTFTYSDSREILIYSYGRLMTLNEAYDKGYITYEILKELNKDHHNCEIAHSFDDGVVLCDDSKEEILYTCLICNATESVALPENFSFTLTYGFDLKYDSKTGHLQNGYNYDLGTKCETTLIFDREELMNIYRILYNGNLTEIREDFDATDQLVIPSYTINIGYTIGEETVEFRIDGASYVSYSEWLVYPEFCYAYKKVVQDFILDSEEYKSMPPNQNIYY